ncbi:MAG: hypothetical protein ACM3ZE_07435 [Myxococcales bacterium]
MMETQRHDSFLASVTVPLRVTPLRLELVDGELLVFARALRAGDRDGQTKIRNLPTKLVPLAGSSAGGCCDSMAALGGRAATAGFGVKPREDEEGRGGVAAPRSGAKRRPDFWRAALAGERGAS